MRKRMCLPSHSVMALLLTAASYSAVATGNAAVIEQKEQPFVLSLGATRVIYAPDSGGSALTVMNVQDFPMLVKSEVFNEDKKTSAPFIVTPPLFRLDGGQQSRVRIVRSGGIFAQDRETLQWVCVTGIPPQADDEWAKQSGKSAAPIKATVNVQISLSTCIKLLVRPPSVKGGVEDVAGSLVWQRQGNTLKVSNPTPFYMNISSATIGGKRVEGLDYIVPAGSREFPLPQGTSGEAEWTVITDLGGASRSYKTVVK